MTPFTDLQDETNDKFFYVALTEPEVQHWLTTGKHDYTNLKRANYWQLNTWSNLQSALTWRAYLESSSYALAPPTDNVYYVAALHLDNDSTYGTFTRRCDYPDATSVYFTPDSTHYSKIRHVIKIAT